MTCFSCGQGCGITDGDAASRSVALAAVLGEVGEQAIHRRIFRRVDQRAAFAAALHQAGLLQVIEMKGERRGWKAQALPDMPCGHPVRSSLNEQPEDIEARFLCQ